MSKRGRLSRSDVYLNGNYIVTQNRYSLNCTKRGLRYGEELVSAFPDSIDLKITDRCDHACPWCHESSVKDGKSYDFDRTIKVLSGLPKDVPLEIAIGGGDVFAETEKTLKLLDWIDKETVWLPRVTLNWRSIVQAKDKITKDPECKIIGLCDCGVSVDSEEALRKIRRILPGDYEEDDDISSLSAAPKKYKKWEDRERSIMDELKYSNLVFHVIAGLLPVEFLDSLIKYATNGLGGRLLILGYKDWGRGKTMKPQHLGAWKTRVAEIMARDRERGRLQGIDQMTLGFDNLALEQLGIKELLTPIEWREVFMGDEGTHSMYVDAVKEEFAISSTSPSRVSWNDMNILGFFKDAINNRG